MNWEEALSNIQSPLFDAELNMVSGTSAFLRTARKQPAVQRTLRLMRESGERREEVLDRICYLATEETDPRYENPNDTPLAILLWLTCYTEPDLARLGARYVERTPRCWYASRLAHYINSPPATKSVSFHFPVDTEPRVSFRNSSTVDGLTALLPPSKISATASLGNRASRTAVSAAEHLVLGWDDGHDRIEAKQSDRHPHPVYGDADNRLDINNWFQSPRAASSAGADF